ncbi:hypothetical protein TNCT_500731, partial [Trichonephila clavata]
RNAMLRSPECVVKNCLHGDAPLMVPINPTQWRLRPAEMIYRTAKFAAVQRLPDKY